MTIQMRWLISLLVTAIIGTTAWLVVKSRAADQVITVSSPTPTVAPTKIPTPTPTAIPTVVPTKKGRPLSSIPFYSQAPLGNWDPDHEDACEEATMFMVHYWLENKKPTLAEYDIELVKLIRWQEARGYGISEGIDEVKKIISDYLSIDSTIETIESIAELREILATGKAIIVPADGKLLQNPHFRNGGPAYHMFVLKGFVDGKFIAHDPGTKFGADYRYDPTVLFNALGNWDGSRVDRNDRRVLLID